VNDINGLQMKAACPRCRLEALPRFRVGDLNRRISGENFDYYRCPDCDILVLWPVPGDVGRYYPNDYYSIPRSLQALAAAAELERYKIEIVQRFRSGGRLLEIGPAYGSFTYLAKQAGFQVDAIEMDESCCRFMRDTLGIHVTQSVDTDAALRGSGPYAVIALWHVIEHLPDPWSTLKLIVDRLEPGGVLVLAAPNPEALQFRMLGRFWTHLDAPRHLELIPSAALSAHLQTLGMKTLLVTTTDEGSLGWNVFGWEMSLANFSRNRYVRRGLRLIGRVISWILAWFENVEGRGSAYTAVYRKGERA
jgi:2-polyprenyl-3-methyl-5-hydroxy-6-metoxy-1,4-benzoquinol methylase